jgi:two-component system phosphate regulon sensor histidine kinase PhoR
VDRLERLADYRRSFLGDVSHELRTPIFAISGFAESLLDGALDDPEVRDRFVEKILANARRLDALARDLAEISRIESGELRMRTAAFDLGPLARETVDALEPLARERGIEASVAVPDGTPAVLGDRGRIQQVLANLVENALKYTEQGGHVRLTADRTSEGVRVAVVDDGIGIATEDVERVTERFFRVDRSRSRSEGGTGLGLSIVKHILEAHGGRLTVESTPGVGSTFAFTLPVDRTRSVGTVIETRQVSPPTPAAR